MEVGRVHGREADRNADQESEGESDRKLGRVASDAELVLDSDDCQARDRVQRLGAERAGRAAFDHQDGVITAQQSHVPMSPVSEVKSRPFARGDRLPDECVL